MPDHPNLIAALAAAQVELTDPKKDRTATVPMKAGGQYSYRYADLAGILQIVRPVLAKHGIALSQPCSMDDHAVYVTTILRHSSDPALTMECTLSWGIPEKIQDMGGSVTYLRRYTLCSLLAIAADDDDDAQAANSSTGKPGRAATAGDPPAFTECPKCRGPVWDNRAKKASGSWKGPTYSCKDKEKCKWAEWGSGKSEAPPPSGDAHESWAKDEAAFVAWCSDAYAKPWPVIEAAIVSVLGCDHPRTWPQADRDRFRTDRPNLFDADPSIPF